MVNLAYLVPLELLVLWEKEVKMEELVPLAEMDKLELPVDLDQEAWMADQGPGVLKVLLGLQDQLAGMDHQDLQELLAQLDQEDGMVKEDPMANLVKWDSLDLQVSLEPQVLQENVVQLVRAVELALEDRLVVQDLLVGLAL